MTAASRHRPPGRTRDADFRRSQSSEHFAHGLNELQGDGTVTDIDVHFARLLADLDGGGSPELLLGSALASAWTREGHACVSLPEVAERHGTQWGAARLPDLDAWIEALHASRVVARPGAARECPLVLDGQGRLYLERLWTAEQAVADGLRGLSGGLTEAIEPDRLEAALDRLFPGTDRDDRSRMAARIAACRRLCVVSGGPGTGKTTVAARIVALLVDLGLAAPGRIALAAPTGKAAARLQEAVRDQHRGLASKVPSLEGYEALATTVHRWLLHRGRDPRRARPVEALVLDEGSMVDLALMARVLDALPGGARLVVLGDASQLASVQPGAVFADLCRAGAVATDPGSSPRSTGLAPCVVTLEKNWRFDPAGGIGRLAAAVVRGDAPAVLEALLDPTDEAVELRPLRDADRFDRLAGWFADERFAPDLRAMEAIREPGESPRSLSSFRVLCAHRVGSFGAERFNRVVERRLRALDLVRARDVFYLGRPILVTRNDPRTGLSNGDTGVVLRDAEDRIQVWFPELGDTTGRYRLVSPARLPPHESFFAVTVHRAQGSEFDDIAVVLGPAESRVATRELLYTAVTRARRRVAVYGTEDSVGAAVERVTVRSSGLSDAIARPVSCGWTTPTPVQGSTSPVTATSAAGSPTTARRSRPATGSESTR